MISYYFRPFILLLFVCISSFGQQTGVFWQPEVVVNYSPSSRWSYNFEITNRNQLNYQTGDKTSFQGDHLEVSHFTSYESGFYSKLSLGVRYRNRDWLNPEQGNEFRLTQQYNYAHGYNQVRVGHRVRFEQRFHEAETVFRTRYRLSMDLPLQGQSLNDNEFFGVITTESLYSLSRLNNPELDHRLTAGLGYRFTKNLKFQLAAEYRYENYLINPSGRVFGYTSALIDL